MHSHLRGTDNENATFNLTCSSWELFNTFTFPCITEGMIDRLPRSFLPGRTSKNRNLATGEDSVRREGRERKREREKKRKREKERGEGRQGGGVESMKWIDIIIISSPRPCAWGAHYLGGTARRNRKYWTSAFEPIGRIVPRYYLHHCYCRWSLYHYHWHLRSHMCRWVLVVPSCDAIFLQALSMLQWSVI